eukprot:1153767-Pelagomonas_calceolata.AAC.6
MSSLNMPGNVWHGKADSSGCAWCSTCKCARGNKIGPVQEVSGSRTFGCHGQIQVKMNSLEA